MPALAAEYAAWPTDPRMPAPELVLMMRASTGSPAFAWSRQWAAACRADGEVALEVHAHHASHSSSATLANMRSRTKPALFTTASSPPNDSRAVATMRAAPSKSATSSPLATASPPASADLVDHLAGRTGPPPGAVELAAEVVDDDPAPWAASSRACARPARAPLR